MIINNIPPLEVKKKKEGFITNKMHIETLNFHLISNAIFFVYIANNTHILGLQISGDILHNDDHQTEWNWYGRYTD